MAVLHATGDAVHAFVEMDFAQTSNLAEVKDANDVFEARIAVAGAEVGAAVPAIVMGSAGAGKGPFAP